MYSTTHFHSTTHEVLCISSGRAKLCKIFQELKTVNAFILTNPQGFGSEHNPSRLETEIKKGDVIVVPAGVGHRLLEDLDGGFEMVGSYPKGKSWNMCYGNAGEKEKIRGIESLVWFERDPLYGDEGPVFG